MLYFTREIKTLLIFQIHFMIKLCDFFVVLLFDFLRTFLLDLDNLKVEPVDFFLQVLILFIENAVFLLL